MIIPYDEIDPGIRKVVRLLNSNNLRTTDSGDGVSKVGGPHEGCMLTDPVTGKGIPNVTMVVAPSMLVEAADHLLALLTKHGVNVGPDEATVTELAGPQPEGTAYGDGVFIEASYDPTSGTAILLLTGLDDMRLATSTVQTPR